MSDFKINVFLVTPFPPFASCGLLVGLIFHVAVGCNEVGRGGGGGGRLQEGVGALEQGGGGCGGDDLGGGGGIEGSKGGRGGGGREGVGRLLQGGCRGVEEQVGGVHGADHRLVERFDVILRHGRLEILPHLQSLPRLSFLPLHNLAQILPARRRPHPAHQQRLADLLLGLLVWQGTFDQPARGGESLYSVVGLDAVAVRASGLQLQLLEERQVLVDGLARLSGGGKVLVVGEQQLTLVLVDRLSYLLSSTLWVRFVFVSLCICVFLYL